MSRELPCARLWHESPSSFNFTTSLLSFPKQLRFEQQSIYWPSTLPSTAPASRRHRSLAQQQAEKISSHIDEEYKNEQRIRVVKTTREKQAKHAPVHKFQLADTPAAVTMRLYKYENKLSARRDSFGVRCAVADDPEEAKPVVGRPKIGLPLNYYPGPGTYTIKRYLDHNK